MTSGMKWVEISRIIGTKFVNLLRIRNETVLNVSNAKMKGKWKKDWRKLVSFLSHFHPSSCVNYHFVLVLLFSYFLSMENCGGFPKMVNQSIVL